MTPPQLMASLRWGRAAGIEQLWIGGGEPTLRRDLLGLIREARAQGYRRVRLQTNAAMLSYPELCRRVVDAGVTELSLSLKGHDAETHDRYARAPGAFDLSSRAIDNARALGLAIEGDVLLYRSSTASLPQIVQTYFSRGISRFRVWMMAPDPRDPEALAEEPRWGEVASAIEATLALGLSNDPDHLISLHSPPCTLSEHAASARFFAPDLGLVVHDAGGSRFRLEDSPMEGGAYAEACDGCALRSRCNGVRREYLVRHGAGELRPRS
jgi:hypothetical protein